MKMTYVKGMPDQPSLHRSSAHQSELRSFARRFELRAWDWGLEEGDLAKLLIVPSDSIAGRDASKFEALDGHAETRMRRLLKLEAVAMSLLAPFDRFGAWLITPNVGLRGATPIECLIADEGALGAILEALVEEHREAFRADAVW